MASQVCVRHVSKKWSLEIVQLTMKQDPFECHVEIHVDVEPSDPYTNARIRKGKQILG